MRSSGNSPGVVLAGMPAGVFGLPLISERELADQFNRHFASKQVSSDIFGTCLGMLVYLALLPSLAQLQRPALVVAAVGCAAACLWPLLLSRWAREFYVRHRDFLLLAHFFFHYAIGGQLGRYVRLQNKIQPSGPAAFLASYILSSTVFWQLVDALLYRMRFKRFLLFKPLVLLATLPLEMRLCQQTCRDFPADAHHFHAAADSLRLLTSPFRLLPVPLALQSTTPTDAAGAVVSCSKVQAFLLVTLCWLLPAYLLHRLEKQMLCQFRQQYQALVVPEDELAALAALAQQAGQAPHDAAAAAAAAATAAEHSGPSGSAAAAARAAVPGTSSSGARQREAALFAAGAGGSGAADAAEAQGRVLARGRELRQRWQSQQERQQDWRTQVDGAAAEDLTGVMRALMVSALTWHLLDIVL